ncbi:glycolate oxidase iron-sulfur subunit [Caldalkalibacillus uzonensis]|uniref:Glycolate oxidase iron-sulfur subunit n=1 Tax=Caldalkalibacillus uzonensis TaxID=353224 RepID=A0ABU0CMN2_9BACI|nr:(Fe-S)-binding protein [Caldalkalibacillus uzonensis]MDQ0337407.1 glycolate oxidase iron-sulfur subunit [Caldalkalibacillus uzonensis]
MSDPARQLYERVHADTNQCIQCGYCLPSCPTYTSMGKESASPRGRINLVKMAAEGKIHVTNDLAEPLDLCLGCRACEVACPVNVPYGHILEEAKEAIAQAQTAESLTWKEKGKRFVLKHVFPYYKRLQGLGYLMWFYQKSPLPFLLRKTKLLETVSEPLAWFEKALPAVENPLKKPKRGGVIPPEGQKKARVALFTGCITDTLMSRTNRLTIELLSKVGCEVVIPPQQTCCGALHAHQGTTEMAKALAKANLAAFEAVEADYYVNNAGGCGAMLREYDRLLASDEDWGLRAERFVAKVRDISELLVHFGPLPFQKKIEGVITYQDSCHLRNVQGVFQEPRELLRSIPGARFVEFTGSERCCASGGIYNLLHYDESMAILEEKMGSVQQSQAQVIVTSNPGCLLQMRLGVLKFGQPAKMRAVHLVDVLAEACGLTEKEV